MYRIISYHTYVKKQRKFLLCAVRTTTQARRALGRSPERHTTPPTKLATARQTMSRRLRKGKHCSNFFKNSLFQNVARQHCSHFFKKNLFQNVSRPIRKLRAPPTHVKKKKKLPPFVCKLSGRYLRPPFPLFFGAHMPPQSTVDCSTTGGGKTGRKTLVSHMSNRTYCNNLAPRIFVAEASLAGEQKSDTH